MNHSLTDTSTSKQDMKKDWFSNLAKASGAILLWSCIFAIFGSRELTPLGLYTLAGAQLFLISVICVGWLYGDFVQYKRDLISLPPHIINNRLIISHISSLAIVTLLILILSAFTLHGIIAFQKPANRTTVKDQTYYSRPESLSGGCIELKEINAFMVASSGYAENCSDLLQDWDERATSDLTPAPPRHISVPSVTPSSSSS